MPNPQILEFHSQIKTNERKPRRSQYLLTASDRALIALKLLGTDCPTIGEAAATVRVSPSYVSTLANATPEERYAVRKGRLTLSALHNKRYPRNLPSDTVIERAVERVIAKYGIDPVWRVFERKTQPALPNLFEEAAE